MKIASFDVGIKNLACCIMEISDTNPDEFKILFWDVLNLTNPSIFPDCSHNVKCNRKTKFYNTNTQQYYCTIHAKKNAVNIVPIPDEYTETNLKKTVQKDLFEIAKTMGLNPIKPITKKVLLLKITEYVKDKYLLPVPKTAKASDIDLIDIGRQMSKVFKERLEQYEPFSHVIIENQISPIASRMKTIQGMIAYHFIIRNEETMIKFISASNKLNAFTDDKIEKYDDRKKAAVSISKQLLNKYPQFN